MTRARTRPLLLALAALATVGVVTAEPALAHSPLPGTPLAAQLGEEQAAARRPAFPARDGSPLCSDHFCVHFTTSNGGDGIDPADADANGLPDYAERVRDALEAARVAQHSIDGWPLPKSDGMLRGDGRIDAYLQELEDEGALGQATIDPVVAEATNIPRAFSSWMRIDNDISAEERSATALADVAAHEYHHVVQQSIDAFQESWFAESMASFIAQRGVGVTHSYTLRGFMPGWIETSTESITSIEADRHYGSAVFMHWLADVYGMGMLRDAWLRSPRMPSPPSGTRALNQSLERRGGLSMAFARFAATTAEWRVPRGARHPRGTSIAEIVTDLPRQGTLRRGEQQPIALDHLSFAHWRVGFRHRPAVRLVASGPRAIGAAIALTARFGPPGNERVKTVLRRFRGDGSVLLRIPPNTRRLTATLVNVDHVGTSSVQDGWTYRDDQSFRITVR